MKTLIKPKKQYYFIPLTFIYGCVMASINYVFWRNVNKAAITIIKGLLICIVFYLLLPALISAIFKVPNILDTNYFLLYLYLISIPSSIYFIKDQENYLNCIKKDW